VSVLKPLCGLDDDLAANLASFAALDHPDLEVLLGVADPGDPAYAAARAAAVRWPGRFRVVVQAGAPGHNPKVNQLITLARAARGDVLVVSDSNVRVDSGYLDGITAALADPAVGLVTHPFVGGPGDALGSLFDCLHLAGAIAPGVIAARRVAGVDIVVGKSMAFRRADLAALGGFDAVKDVLAEDFVLGRLVAQRLGKKVALGRVPVLNVSRRASAATFFARYLRWSVIHRKTAGTPAYLCELFLNPILAATLAVALNPSLMTLAALAAVSLAKIGIDATTTHILFSALRPRPEARGPRPFPRGPRPEALLLIPAKDLLIGLAWARAIFSDTVDWRGHKLRVLPGTRLALPQERPASSAAIA
jgi:ceramide glucosyltransferase